METQASNKKTFVQLHIVWHRASPTSAASGCIFFFRGVILLYYAGATSNTPQLGEGIKQRQVSPGMEREKGTKMQASFSIEPPSLLPSQPVEDGVRQISAIKLGAFFVCARVCNAAGPDDRGKRWGPLHTQKVIERIRLLVLVCVMRLEKNDLKFGRHFARSL